MVDAQRGNLSITVEYRDQIHDLKEVCKLLVQLRFLYIVFGIANCFVDSTKEGKNWVGVKVKQSIDVKLSFYFSVDDQIAFNISAIKESVFEYIED